MNTTQQKKCNQCLQVFNKIKLPLKMIGCKHNLCGQCLQQIRTSKIDTIQCQFCDNTCVKITKKSFQPNRPLAVKIQKSQLNKQSTPQTQNSPNNISIPFSENSPLHQQSQVLLTQQQPNIQEKSHIKRNNHKICPQHDKPLQIVCITDEQMICPHCAIFGNHKDHIFKTIKQFNTDYELKYEKLQQIKQKKYIYDKKIKGINQKQYIQQCINRRKMELRRYCQQKFKKIIQQIKSLQQNIYIDLNKKYNQVFVDILTLFDQDKKQQIDYFKWESQCQNCLDQLDQNNNINQKIKLLYNSVTNVEDGEGYLDKLNKKLDFKIKKMDYFINSITIQFQQNANMGNIAKLIKKQQLQSDNFVQLLDKISLPLIHKHLVQQQLGQFKQNSFINDFSKQDLLEILNGETKVRVTPAKSVKANSKSKSKILPKFQSPPPKTFSKINNGLARVHSSSNLNSSTLNKSEIDDGNRGVGKSMERRNPQTIIKNYLENNLNQVLDLSFCDLNDQQILKYIKDVRKNRKIRGLKLCQNSLTDNGLQSIIEYLGATTNINLSYNKLTDNALNLLISKKDKICPLRIVNMSYNNINQKKAKIKIQSLKKIGMIVNI